MEIFKAQEEDSPRLIEFFAKQKVEGAFNYHIQRHGSFFNKYRLLTDDFVTYGLEEKGRIEGVASLIFTDAVLGGEPHKIALAVDLRISPRRRAILNWAQLFFEKFDQACRERDCEFVFSAVERFEGQAYNALIRPQRTRRILPRYYLFRKFLVVGLHGLWPWAPRPLKSIKISPLRLDDAEELVAYMKLRQGDSALHLPISTDRLIEKTNRYPNMTLDDFLIARDSVGKIVGCASLWKPDAIQSQVVDSYHGRSEQLYQVLSLGRMLGLTRKVSSPGEPLNYTYLTGVFFNNPDIFYTILREAWRRIGRDEFLVYSHYNGDFARRPPQCFISSAVPYGFYTVLRPHVDLHPFLRPNPWSGPPDIELPVLL